MGSQTWAILRAVFVVLAVAGALWIVYALRSVILLVVLSIFFAYLLAPLVRLFSRPFHLRGRERRLSGALAIGVVYIVLFGLLTVTLMWLIPRLSQQIAQMSSQAPAYVAAAQSSGRQMTALYDRFHLPPDTRQAIDRTLATVAGSAEAAARRAVMSVVGLISYLPWFVLIPILGFFFLKDGPFFRRAVLAALPPGRARANAAQLFERINAALAAYIRAQLVACVIVGTIVGVGFTLLGVPYPVILGVLAGLAEFIPLVGPFVVAVVAAVIAAVHAGILAVWVLVFLGIVRVAEDYVIYPRLVGHTIDLHPLAIILAVLAGAELAGVAGVFLAVPALAVLSAVYRQYLASTGSEGLVADLLQPPGNETDVQERLPGPVGRAASR